jgi:hypothetical protein
MVRFLVARGKGLAFLLAGLVLLACVLAGFASGQFWLLPAGIVAGTVLLGLLLSYVEVLRIIADTLIPKY